MTTNIITPDIIVNTPLFMEKTYAAWQDGEIRADEALNYFCKFLAQVQDKIGPLELAEKQVRAWASEVVDYLGGQAQVDGFGELKITSPTVSYSYDKKLVDQLTNQLRTEGLGDVASRLDACLKSSSKVGYLKINRVKEARP
jgi:hypothetical protein